MEENIKDTREKIIQFLKKKRISNSKEIAKLIGKECHNGKFKTMLNYMCLEGYIENTKTNTYIITPSGDEFESYKKTETESKGKEELENKINQLTIENLNLQNKNIRRHVAYSVIAFLAGAIFTNLKYLLSIIQTTHP